MGVLQFLRRKENEEGFLPYRESRELARSLRRRQARIQTSLLCTIIVLAISGFVSLAFLPRPTTWTPALFVYTGIPFLGAFIALLIGVHRRGEEALERLQEKEMEVLLLADEILLEQENPQRTLPFRRGSSG